jgi:hypothetical protein
MKIVQTEISAFNDSHFTLLRRDETHFGTPFHFHPEVELVYVQESFGKRIIGDKIEPFEAGDMVFIGSNLPHVWLNDEAFYKNNSSLRAKSVVLYFNVQVFGSDFYQMKEASKINEFLKYAERGVSIKGVTKDLIAKKLEELFLKKDFDRIIGILEIFNILSNSKDIQFITSEAYCMPSNNMAFDRMPDLYKYIHENYMNDISLTTISNIASLTPQSFCRMFKKKTNKHFIEYLNEVRISKACKYLLETDWSISEIAYNSGYKTVSNFNKLFKEITGGCPKAYRANSISKHQKNIAAS